jgi:hypothetical protein
MRTTREREEGTKQGFYDLPLDEAARTFFIAREGYFLLIHRLFYGNLATRQQARRGTSGTRNENN